VALMQHRRFTPEDFRGFHPGGRLGARLATVADLMHRDDEVPLVEPEAPMADALIEMSRKGFGVVGVVEDGRLAGVITDGDLRRNMEGLLGRTAGAVMTRGPRVIATTALASEALGLMNAVKITTLFASDPAAPEAPAGILHIHDLLRAGVT
jgi:arabinose-5-phosphate isomerase